MSACLLDRFFFAYLCKQGNADVLICDLSLISIIPSTEGKLLHTSPLSVRYQFLALLRVTLPDRARHEIHEDYPMVRPWAHGAVQ